MKIIAFGHQSRTGKNTAAETVRELFWGENRVARKNAFRYFPAIMSFAKPVKNICYQLYSWDGMMPPRYYEKHPEERHIPLPTIGKTPVQIWNDLGTKAVRDCVYVDTWVKLFFADNKHFLFIVIPDLRFPNEFEEIRSRGGKCIKLIRRGVNLPLAPADIPLQNETRWDKIIEADDGDIEGLKKQVISYMQELADEGYFDE